MLRHPFVNLAILFGGFICYLMSLFAFICLIIFLIPQYNSLLPSITFEYSIVNKSITNILLLVLWIGLQQILTNEKNRRILSLYISEPFIQSIYCFITSTTSLLLIFLWQSTNTEVWSVNLESNKTLIWGAFGCGIAMSIYSSLLTGHLDLLGLRHIWLYLQNKLYKNMPFTDHSIYKMTRHPMMLGVLIFIWATPYMTLDHVIFSIGMSIFIFIRINNEERSLIHRFGKKYIQYQRETDKIIPWIY